jgi:methylated-DNA-[protein]-cysteine S-methyltransferase
MSMTTTTTPTRGAAATGGWDVYESPIGPLTLIASESGLRGLRFPGEATPDRRARSAAAVAGPVAQLEQYFAGERQAFEVDLDLRGNPFQLAAWSELRTIPFGTTVSYKELAQRIGRSDRIRAVGGCVARTPVPIIVPCHRVIGSDGSLTGYGGGLERKAFLLEHERQVATGQHALL